MTNNADPAKDSDQEDVGLGAAQKRQAALELIRDRAIVDAKSACREVEAQVAAYDSTPADGDEAEEIARDFLYNYSAWGSIATLDCGEVALRLEFDADNIDEWETDLDELSPAAASVRYFGWADVLLPDAAKAVHSLLIKVQRIVRDCPGLVD